MDKPSPPPTHDVADRTKLSALKKAFREGTPGMRSEVHEIYKKLAAQNILNVQNLEEATDHRIKLAEKALQRAEKDLELAREEKKIKLEALKRKGRGYRANVKAAEEVMRSRDGWESDDEDEDEDD